MVACATYSSPALRSLCTENYNKFIILNHKKSSIHQSNNIERAPDKLQESKNNIRGCFFLHDQDVFVPTMNGYMNLIAHCALTKTISLVIFELNHFSLQ